MEGDEPRTRGRREVAVLISLYNYTCRIKYIYFVPSPVDPPLKHLLHPPLGPAYQDRLAETRRVSALTQPAETPCQTAGSVVCQIANKLLVLICDRQCSSRR